MPPPPPARPRPAVERLVSRPAPLREPPPSRSDETGDPLSGVASVPANEPPLEDPGNPTFQRIFAAFVVSRALLGTLLLLIQVVLMVYSVARPSLLAIGVSAIYAVATIVTLRWSVHMPQAVTLSGYLKRRWMLLTVGVDLGMFALLLLVGTGLNVAAMFALPVLMTATLSSRRVALAVAAAVSLILLGAASVQWLAGGDPAALYTQVGLAGAGLFVLSALTGELAGRLARQEEAARSTLELARQQALLNRLVIEEMQEGLMVVNRNGHVRAANPAALGLIGAPERPWASSFDLRGVPNWQTLAQAVDEAFATGSWPETGRDVVVRTGREAQGVERQLRLRLRFTRRRSSLREPLCVLFLEDLRSVQARARKEKLAAMGRVSAGIAHEIRNPLAAIAQANALLAEDLAADPHHSRLTGMVNDNVVRLRRIVEDVLEFAPAGPAVPAATLELVAQVRAICDDWARTVGLPAGEGGPLYFRPVDEVIHVRFDLDHLRRVLVNLLDNALRHGTRQERSVWVQISLHGSSGVRLWVANDGDPIAANVEPYLFEPFFSTRSRGSGLGLYICRELCERYGATIEFRLRRPPARHRNAFMVTMPCV
jgi:two-component system sensor histidine kinase PilS (NtrC family)